MKKHNKNTNGLVGIDHAAEVFEIGEDQARHYKALGIIVPADKDGPKDLYDPKELISGKKYLDGYRTEKTLKQIGQEIERKIKLNRKRGK